MRIVAGSLSVLLGLGFGLPCLFGIRHFARTGEVPSRSGVLVGMPIRSKGPLP